MTILLINVLLPTVNTLFPSTKGVLFSFVFSLAVLAVSGAYQTLFKAILFLIGFGLAYFASDYWLHSTLLASMFRVMLLFIPCLTLAWLLAAQYHSSEILSALQDLHLPKVFIVALIVLLRYIVVFRREFQLIRSAMKIRGVQFSLFHPLRTIEYLLVPQLFRCLTLSNELTIASLTKGVTAPVKRTSYFKQGFSIYDYGLATVLIGGFTLIIGGVL